MHFDQWDRPAHPIGAVFSFASLVTYHIRVVAHDQSGCEILTDQDSGMWTNQTVQIWILHLQKDGPIEDQDRHFIQASLSLSWWSTLLIPLEAASPCFANCSE